LAAASGDATLATAALDEVSVAVTHSGNIAAAVSAGPDRAISLGVPTIVAGTVTDDGLPEPPGAVAVQWSKVSGPGTVTFGTPDAPTTTVSLAALGAYVLRLAANDGEATTFSEMMCQVENLPVLDLVVDDHTASEYTGDEGGFTVHRAGGTGQAVQVRLAYAGSGSNGTDVDLLPDTIGLSPGQVASGTVVRALADALSEGPESLEIYLLADAAYLLGTNTAGAVTIADTPIDDWRFAWFGAQANTPPAEDLADWDGDGYDNLWEYGTGGRPTLHDTGLSPRLDLVPGAVVLTYQAAAQAPDVSWSAFGTDALAASWTRAVPAGSSTNTVDPATLEIHWTFPIGTNDQRFLKLQLQRP
jgi:hypothetical protein